MVLNLFKKKYWVCAIGLILISISCKENKTDKNQKPTPTPVVLKTGGDQLMPKQWIDVDTHHKIKKLVQREGDNKSFYFHNNPFLPTKNGTGSLMVFYGNTKNKNQLFSLNLQTNEIVQITHKSGNIRGEILGKKSRKVFFMIKDSVFTTHIDTHKTTFIYKFSEDVIGSITSINADETLLGGALITKEENEIFKKNPKKDRLF